MTRASRSARGARGWLIVAALFAINYGMATPLAAYGVFLPILAETFGGATLTEALADPRQWLLNVAWLVQGGLALMISVHVVPFTRDQGVPLASASLALTAYGMGSVAGRITAGAVSDALGVRTTIGAAYLIQAVGLAALLLWPSAAARFAAIVAFGVGFAASDTMVVKVIPDVFGLKAIGAIMGVLALGWRFGAALGPAIAGVLYDATGSYHLAFGLAPIAVLASWGCFAAATSRRRHVA